MIESVTEGDTILFLENSPIFPPGTIAKNSKGTVLRTYYGWEVLEGELTPEEKYTAEYVPEKLPITDVFEGDQLEGGTIVYAAKPGTVVVNEYNELGMLDTNGEWVGSGSPLRDLFDMHTVLFAPSQENLSA